MVSFQNEHADELSLVFYALRISTRTHHIQKVFTLKGFLARVRTQVDFQVAFAREFLLALITFKRVLFSMSTQMTFQIFFMREFLETYITLN